MYTQRHKERYHMQSQAKQLNQNPLTNYMEILTDNLLDEILSEQKNTRLTKKAVRDVKALALNRLWPMYLTTETGKDFIRKIVIEDKRKTTFATE